MKNNKYQIRYQHTSWTTAGSLGAAKRAVKNEGHVRRLFYSDCDDGLYCYLSREDKDSDDTGASSYAVICGPTQQGE